MGPVLVDRAFVRLPLHHKADVPGVYFAIAMLPCLIPAGIFAIALPRWGGVVLTVVGAVGVIGTLLEPSFYHRPIYIGAGSFMYMVAVADGLMLKKLFNE